MWIGYTQFEWGDDQASSNGSYKQNELTVDNQLYNRNENTTKNWAKVEMHIVVVALDTMFEAHNTYECD